MAYQESTDFTSEWKAVVIKDVIEQDLLSFTERDELWRALPVRRVNPLKQDPSEVAVLSWRWDTDDNQPSKNVLAVIRYAKQNNIQFLFLDVIAIEQTVDSNKMIAQVLDFSRLYKTIPVIAAYDSNDDFTKTMRRPWIAHEVHAFENNPHSVTYVSHSGQGDGDFGFLHMVSRMHGSVYTCSILGVLSGTFQMHSISDLKFLLPAFSNALEISYSLMSRNDYLLTAAILCPQSDYANSYNNNITALLYNDYHFRRNHEVPSSSWTYHDTFLSDVKVAKWRYKYNAYIDTEKAYFEIEPRAEQTIMEFLGLPMPKHTDATAKDARETSTDERAKSTGPDLRVYRMVASREGKCTFEARHVEA